MTLNHQPTPADRLLVTGLLRGLWLARACQTAARLGVFDELSDGPRAVEELAKAIRLHVGALYRLLRALTAVDLLAEVEPGTFALTGAGALVTTAMPGTLHATVVAADATGNALFDQLDSVLAGGGQAALPSGAPEANALHDLLAAADPVPTALAAIDLGTPATIACLGDPTGSVLDHVVASCPDAKLCNVADGDIDPAELYLLCRFLRALPDDEAAGLLAHVRACGRPNARLLIVEKVLPDEPVFHPAKIDDLLTMLLLPGRERTHAQWRALLDAVGIDFVTIHDNAIDLTGESVVEARLP